MSQRSNVYKGQNGKPNQPPEEPIDPKDPDTPYIEDPAEPTDPEDPIQEPVKSSSYYDPNNLRNYIRMPDRQHIH